MRFFGFLISFSIFACIISTLTILPVVIFMVKPAFLMRKKTQTRQEGLEVPMAVPSQELQPELVKVSEYPYEAPRTDENPEA
jgi:predicted RND superfamily exporter protein